jgi:hypothetical protein
MFTRLLVALLLALAIPLQGLGSVTAGLYMSLGHQEAGLSMMHDHGGDHESGRNHSTPDDEGSDAARCALGVACCAAASIAPAAQIFVPDDAPAAANAPLPCLHSGFVPEKLDRPPLAL